jgi:valine dehydrogenase (NAD+)
MSAIARESRFVTGRPTADGGAGDSAVLTAFGVFQGMRAAATRAWGTASLRGRRVGVSGVGKVGLRLVEHLVNDGESVVVSDLNHAAIERVQSAYRNVGSEEPDKIHTLDLDVYAPCALGSALNDETVSELQARVVCGSANNQLAEPRIDQELKDRGILYAPDYVVNAGGLIQVADEIDGYDAARARRHAATIFDTTARIFELAESEGIAPGKAADMLAERRIAAGGQGGIPWLAPGARG